MRFPGDLSPHWSSRLTGTACIRKRWINVCGIYLMNPVISAKFTSPGGPSKWVEEMQKLQCSLLSAAVGPWRDSSELRGLFPCAYHLHLLLSKKPQPGPGTEMDMPKCRRTFHGNVAGLMGTWQEQKCQESSLLRFRALCCKFNSPNWDQMSQVQITVQTFSWGMKPNLCSQTIPNVLITSFSLLYNPIQESIVISLIADASFAHQWKI